MTRTSAEWWAEVKADPDRFIDWLRRQFHGETTAAPRIRALGDRPDITGYERMTLNMIAAQEETHATWVADLLRARGIEPTAMDKEERYWNETLSEGDHSFEHMSAVAAHAELMRLERIRVIAADPEAPKDVRKVFAKILCDEEFHAAAFSRMAGRKALEAAKGNHERGMAALGLTI